MLREGGTSPRASNKLSFQRGERSLSASLMFFEHIHRSNRDKSTRSQILPKIAVKCCRSLEVFIQDGWARHCYRAYRAPRCPSTHVSSSSLPKCLREACACARYPCLAWGAEGLLCSVTNGVSKECKLPMQIFCNLFPCGFPHIAVHPGQCTLSSPAVV